MHGLEAVAHVGQRAPDDDGHRVVEVAPPDLLLDGDGDLLGRVERRGLFGVCRPTQMSRLLDVQRVRLDELAPRLDGVAHEDREDLVGLDGVLDAHLQEAARGRVHRRLPERLGVHLAEALVAVDREALLRRSGGRRRRPPGASRARARRPTRSPSAGTARPGTRRSAPRARPPCASRSPRGTRRPRRPSSVTPFTACVTWIAWPPCSSSARISNASTTAESSWAALSRRRAVEEGRGVRQAAVHERPERAPPGTRGRRGARRGRATPASPRRAP